MDSMLFDKINRLRQAMATVIVGMPMATELMLTAILADGHILLEGVPGVAKTLMAKNMARLMGVKFGRVQFTPDLMPSDILGTEVYDQANAKFNFHPGPVFAQVVLADEINRSPAKTQAALFEVMEERQATVAGKSYKMSPIFTIIATQNPIEHEGTYRLPEAQLDRFLCKIVMGYPSADEEVEILKRHNRDNEFTRLHNVAAIITPDDMLELRNMMHNVIVDEALMRYIANITVLSRQSPVVALPASPRAAVSMMRMAKAWALLQGRDFATPDDVRQVAPSVLSHRIMLTTDAEMEGLTVANEIQRLLANASAELSR